jgi:F-type H+-transporting ATPase subunit a
MEIQISPTYTEFFGLHVSQSLFASVLWLISFGILAWAYVYMSRKNSDSKFVQFVEYIIEMVLEMFEQTGQWKFNNFVLMFVSFLFIFISWNNLVWLVGDIFILFQDEHTQHLIHPYFRPLATDVSLNLILAFVGVVISIWYGFYVNGFSYIAKYIPYHGMWIVPNDGKLLSKILKVPEFILWQFIGLIEFIGEFSKMISLSLRLFGNILAGMILVTLVTAGLNSLYVSFGDLWLLWKAILAPLQLLVIIYEFAVSLLQWFVFSTLLAVFFGAASESHH